MSNATFPDDQISVGDSPAKGEVATASLTLSGPLAAFGAVRYELGRDQVWVIGRLPTATAARQR